MTRRELNGEYFDWMCQLVYDEKYSKRLSYRKLLRCLHDIPFYYTIELDANREVDGIDLRYRFGDEQSYPQAMIASYLDDRPCSVLEMMIALSMRCEEHIMDDPDIGDRIGQWFWTMVVNLGLGAMNDSKFDEERVKTVIDRLLERDYAPNGAGGLFKVDNCRYDMRTVEIWYQMCFYLDGII